MSISAKAPKNPTHIWIEPTNKCNARCIHCHHHYYDFGEDMPREIFEVIQRDLLPGAEEIILTGYGEPFLSRNFEPFLQDCLKGERQIFVITNGIMLMKERVRKALMNSNVTVTLSMDGARPETLEDIRRNVKWDNMIRVLEWIRSVAEDDSLPEKPNFILQFVSMKRNVDEMPGIVEIAHRYRIPEVVIMPLYMEDNYPMVAGESLFHAPERIPEPTLRALSYAARKGIMISFPPAYVSLVRQKSLKSRLLVNFYNSLMYLRRKGFAYFREKLRNRIRDRKRVKAFERFCDFPWRAAYFNLEGKVFPCCVQTELMGDLKEESWEQIWNGEKYQSLRRTIHGWNPTELCRFCNFFTGINGGDAELYPRYFSRFRESDIPLDSPGVELSGDFYDLERDAEGAPTHAWMGRAGRINLPMKPGARFIRIRTSPRFPQNQFNAGKCVINGSGTEYFDNTCSEIHIPLDAVSGDSVRLELEMNRAFTPEGDDRKLALPVMKLSYLIE